MSQWRRDHQRKAKFSSRQLKYSKFDFLATPGGMETADFGKKVMIWDTGDAEAIRLWSAVKAHQRFVVHPCRPSNPSALPAGAHRRDTFQRARQENPQMARYPCLANRGLQSVPNTNVNRQPPFCGASLDRYGVIGLNALLRTLSLR